MRHHAKTPDRSGRTMRLLLAAAASMAMLPACQSSDCTGLRSSIPLAGFYAYRTGEAVSLDSLDIGGVNAVNDSLLVSAGTTAANTYLPLRSTVPATAFCIHYAYRALADEANNDTITLRYESIPYFESQECGAMYRYRITAIDYTRHLIDSIGCSDSTVTNNAAENMRIYFRVEPDTPAEGGES